MTGGGREGQGEEEEKDRGKMKRTTGRRREGWGEEEENDGERKRMTGRR